MRRAVLLAALPGVLLLAGCGTQTDLKPKQAHQLPPVPYGRKDRPGSGELLSQSSQARPGRNVELRTRSEQRTDDPFDLPPED